jgi:hypothetical protein
MRRRVVRLPCRASMCASEMPNHLQQRFEKSQNPSRDERDYDQFLDLVRVRFGQEPLDRLAAASRTRKTPAKKSAWKSARN